MYVRAKLEDPVYGYYMFMTDRIWYYGGHYLEKPRVEWHSYNSTGNWEGPTDLDPPFSGSFNFVIENYSRYSIYLDGSLIVTGLSMPPLYSARYFFYMDQHNPCIEMDGSFALTDGNSLYAWAKDQPPYYIVSTNPSYDGFEVYTQPF